MNRTRGDGVDIQVGQVFGYLNFLLPFCPTHPSEKETMARSAKLGIGAGKPFSDHEQAPETKKAVETGIAAVWQEDFAGFMKRVNAGEVPSGDSFGTREFLKNNYPYRFAGTKLGLYGNSREEALYPPYFVDAQGDKLDDAKHAYLLRFEKGQLPLAGAFWSYTLYNQKHFFVPNEIKRYSTGTKNKALQFNPDGSLTICIQHKRPAAEKTSNWLPAPEGEFAMTIRAYGPREVLIKGDCSPPPVKIGKG